MLRAFDDLVREGKMLYTGCSNFEAWRLMEALWLSEAMAGSASPATSRNTAWWCATSTRRSCPCLQLKGLGCVAWSPLGSGYLAGKYTPGSLKVQGTRSAEGWGFQSRFFAPNHAEILQTLLDVAKELGKLAGPGGAALGDGPAVHDQRDRRRPQRRAARRDAGGRRLAPAGRGAGQAQQGFGPADGAIRAPSRSRCPSGATPPSKCRE